MAEVYSSNHTVVSSCFNTSWTVLKIKLESTIRKKVNLPLWDDWLDPGEFLFIFLKLRKFIFPDNVVYH